MLPPEQFPFSSLLLCNTHVERSYNLLTAGLMALSKHNFRKCYDNPQYSPALIRSM